MPESTQHNLECVFEVETELNGKTILKHKLRKYRTFNINTCLNSTLPIRSVSDLVISVDIFGEKGELPGACTQGYSTGIII